MDSPVARVGDQEPPFPTLRRRREDPPGVGERILESEECFPARTGRKEGGENEIQYCCKKRQHAHERREGGTQPKREKAKDEQQRRNNRDEHSATVSQQ